MIEKCWPVFIMKKKKHSTSNLMLAVCPECGKRVLHPRGKLDPKKAIWCFLDCDDCSESGDKDYSITYFGEHGWIEYDGKRWHSPLIERYHLYNAMMKEQLQAKKSNP